MTKLMQISCPWCIEGCKNNKYIRFLFLNLLILILFHELICFLSIKKANIKVKENKYFLLSLCILFTRQLAVSKASKQNTSGFFKSRNHLNISFHK